MCHRVFLHESKSLRRYSVNGLMTISVDTEHLLLATGLFSYKDKLFGNSFHQFDKSDGIT